MNVWGVLFVSTLAALLCPETVFCVIKPRSTGIQQNNEHLYNILKSIPELRHHGTVDGSKSKDETRKLIIKHFMNAGLGVSSQEVKIQLNNVEVKGENIVGTRAGSTFGKPDEKIVIVGAHYDTVDGTPGVDDNASGLTALLEAAKKIGERETPKHSIQFVAFDFEEFTSFQYGIAYGSSAFASGLKTSGASAKVKGALILETILNHNLTEDSQTLPAGFGYLFQNALHEIQQHRNRGNFLAVIGREKKDKDLLHEVIKNFAPDADYRAQLVSIPDGTPDNSIGDLLRSDHASFWKNGIPALMLTDTADFRGYMRCCYHKRCDRIEFVEENNLEFLRRTIDAVVETVWELANN